MFSLPTSEEIESILKKLDMGFGLTDREIWVCKEILDR